MLGKWLQVKYSASEVWTHLTQIVSHGHKWWCLKFVCTANCTFFYFILLTICQYTWKRKSSKKYRCKDILCVLFFYFLHYIIIVVVFKYRWHFLWREKISIFQSIVILSHNTVLIFSPQKSIFLLPFFTFIFLGKILLNEKLQHNACTIKPK